jgi:predicted nucleic acid-binding protein
MGNLPRLYLDVCTLCRPFDDQRSLRIRLETDAYYLVLQHIRMGRFQLVASPVHLLEISAIEIPCERQTLLALLDDLAVMIPHQPDLQKRAELLVKRGLGIADAAHIAYAERNADFFLSVDDRLLRKAARIEAGPALCSPVQFCLRKDLK